MHFRVEFRNIKRSSFDELDEEDMKNQLFKAEYEALGSEFELIKKRIKEKNKRDSSKRLTAQEFKKIQYSVFNDLTIETLIAYVLKDACSIEDQINQIKAANTLGHLKDQISIAPLIKVLSEGKLYSRLAVSEALGKIGLPAVQDLIQQLGKIRETQDVQPPEKAFWNKSYYVHDPAARTLVRIGKASIPALIECIKICDDFEAQQAIDAVGRIGEASITEFLINEFDTRTNSLTKWKIVRAVGELRNNRSTAFLIAILSNQKYESFIRWEAADGLGKIGDSNAINVLIVSLKSESKEICRASARALGKIGDTSAIQELQQLLAGLPKDVSLKSIQYEISNALMKLKKE